MEWLRWSVETGYANADWMVQDPDLEALRGLEFDALVQVARKNAMAKRAD